MKKLFDFTIGIPENISSALGWTLFHSLWQGIVIVVLFGIFRHLFKTSDARYRLGIGALGMQMVAALITFLMVYEPAAQLANGAGHKKFTAFFIKNAASDAESLSAFSTGKLSFLQQAEIFIQANLDTFVLFWFIGANLLLLRLIAGFVYVQQLKVQQTRPVKDEVLGIMEDLYKKMNLRVPVKLLESSKAIVPMTIGWLKPIVLLPVGVMSGLSIAQLEAVLAHELAHIKRYDYLINIFQSFVEIIFFFHPAIWFISAQVRDERENCCDDYAVKICGDRLTLARALTQVATYQQQPRLAMAFGARRQTFMDRIKRIVGINDAKPMSYGNWAVFVGLVLIIAVGVAYGQERIANVTGKSNKSVMNINNPKEEFDFYFFEKENKNVGVYKNKEGKIVKIVADGRELAGVEFETMKVFALDFLKAQNSSFAVVPGISAHEMDEVQEQFLGNAVSKGDTSRLSVVEKEMEQLSHEMEKYSREMDKHGKQIDEKYSKLMEKHGREMERVSLKMREPQRKLEGIFLEKQEVHLAMQKIEHQFREAKMPADVIQKLQKLEKKDRELETQMQSVEDQMRNVEEEMLPIQRKMESLNHPMDSLQRIMERYHKPMDSLVRLMEEKGKVMEKLAKEEEIRFKKEFAEFAEFLYKEGLIKDKKDFEIRLKGEKLLINLEPQSAAVYEKVWNWINKTWSNRMNKLKERDFRIEVNGESMNFNSFSSNGSTNHYFGSVVPPMPPTPVVAPHIRGVFAGSPTAPTPPSPVVGHIGRPAPVIAPRASPKAIPPRPTAVAPRPAVFD